jgi:hypothetical protein
MILRITVKDNDFTQELEQFAENIELSRYVCATAKNEAIPIDERIALFERTDRFRELFYHTSKFTSELSKELCNIVRENFRLWVYYEMKDHSWWSDTEKLSIREYLIKAFDVKFQKSLTPKWENGEVVYICCGYYNRHWTF